MKVFSKILLLIGILSVIGGKGVMAEKSLQALINATPAGETLILQKGTYKESIVINKPIHLIGEKGTIIKACSSKPVMKIEESNVALKGIKLESCQQAGDAPVLSISGKNHLIEDVEIHAWNLGVKLENTVNTTMRNVKIAGIGEENGFDLWESQYNTFENIQIDHVQDGFYVENSSNNKFIGNKISESRYGIHVMYSNNILIENNSSLRNFTGAMIMGSINTVIKGNHFTENNQNVHSQGLLLFEVNDSKIIKNEMTNNRVGLYMEGSTNNQVSHNEFSKNFVGTQVKDIQNNDIENNIFNSNINEMHAVNSAQNHIDHNFWDAALKLDSDGDGISNLPYRADPYFFNLTMDVPEYQVFFQHPGMMLLQKMLKSPEHLLVLDEQPLMETTVQNRPQQELNNRNSWILSFVLIFGSILFVYIGRRKT